MAFNVSHLPSPIATRLRQFYFRKQALALGRVAFAVVIFYAVAIFIATHIDRFAFLSVGTRLAMLIVVHAIALAIAVSGVIHWWWRSPSPRAIAYELEQALHGAAGERIVTLESVLRRKPAGETVGEGGAASVAAGGLPETVGQRLVEQLKSATVRFSEGGEGQQVAALVRDRWFHRLGIICAVLLAIGILLAVPASYQWPLMIARFYQPTNQNLAKPSFIKLTVTPTGKTVGRGGELVIDATLEDQTPFWLSPLMDLLGASADRVRLSLAGPEVAGLPAEERNLFMSRIQRNRYLHTRSDLQEDLTFRLRTGNAQAGPYKVDVVVQPTITDLTIGVVPPNYTWPEGPEGERVEPEPEPVEQPDEPVRVLQGSKVLLSFSADQQVTEARLEPVEGGKIIELDWDEQTNSAAKWFDPNKSMSYRLIIVSEHGFENVERPTISIAVSEDLPPTITLRYPPSEFIAVGPQIVPLEADLQDNLGIETVEVTYILNPNPVEDQMPKRLPVDLGERVGQAKIDLNSQIDLAETGAVPGDTVLVQIRAGDAAGGESTSRAVLVRVVPFSRGEHERQRLATLGAVNDVLGTLLDPEGDAAPADLAVGRTFDDAVWNRITDTISGANAPLPDMPNIGSLFKLLQLEHDLTEGAADRRDMRQTIGVLRIAAEPRLRGEDQMAAALATLTEEVIPKLRRYRISRNLSARLFGLRNEANRLKGELQTRPDGTRPNLAAINRRAKLYLDALQATGEDLLGLARASELLNAETLEPRVAEMNTDGFFLTSGGLASRRRAVDGLQTKLTAVIDALQGAIPTLYEDALAGRATLRSQYRTAKGRALDTIEASPDAKTLEAATAWLEAEQQMLDHDPFTPIAERVARTAMLDVLSRDVERPTEQPDWRAGVRVMRGTEPAADRLALDALGRQVQLARLFEADLPGVELAFSVGVLRMEAAGATGDAESVKAAAERLRALPVSRDAAEEQRVELDLSDLPLPANARAALRTAGRNVTERFGDVAVADMLDRMAEANTVAQAAIEQLSAAMGGEGAKVVAAAREADEALTAAGRISRGARAMLAATLNRIPGADERAERVDALRQKWTEDYTRFLARTAPGRQALSRVATGEAAADQISQLSGNLGRFKILHEVWAKQVRELKDAWLGAEEAESLTTQDTLLNQTRQLAGLSLIQAADEASRARAMEALQEFEAAPGMWLNSWADEAARAWESIKTARAALEAETVQAERIKKLAANAADELGRAVEALSAAKENAQIARSLGEIESALGLAQAVADMPVQTEASIVRARYAAADLAEDLKVLADDLSRAGGRVERGDYFRLPTRGWTTLFENDIRHREQQLNAFADQANRQALLGVVMALREDPDTSAFERGYAWIAAAYRLARSDLYTPGGRRIPPPPTPPGGGKFIEFLLNELQESRQQPDVPFWSDRISPYLDGVEDAIQFYATD